MVAVRISELPEHRRFQRVLEPDHGSQTASRRLAFLLEEDDELAQCLPAQQRRQASVLLGARVIELRTGEWEPPRLDAARAYGLLILDGLMARRVRVPRGTAMEILGPGDIMRPGEDPSLDEVVPVKADWEIVEPVRLAVLDEHITVLIGRWPELSVAFSGRLLRRTQRLAFLLAVSHMSRLEDRLLATLWYLATSWGRVTPDGVTVPINLTHHVLGEMTGAQRSSVTLAMTSLRDSRLVLRRSDGTYLLRGDPAGWQQPPASAPKVAARAS